MYLAGPDRVGKNLEAIHLFIQEIFLYAKFIPALDKDSVFIDVHIAKQKETAAERSSAANLLILRVTSEYTMARFFSELQSPLVGHNTYPSATADSSRNLLTY
jgi:hypothetical protein